MTNLDEVKRLTELLAKDLHFNWKSETNNDVGEQVSIGNGEVIIYIDNFTIKHNLLSGIKEEVVLGFCVFHPVYTPSTYEEPEDWDFVSIGNYQYAYEAVKRAVGFYFNLRIDQIFEYDSEKKLEKELEKAEELVEKDFDHEGKDIE